MPPGPPCQGSGHDRHRKTNRTEGLRESEETVFQVSHGIGMMVVVGVLIGFWIVRRRIILRRPGLAAVRSSAVDDALPARPPERVQVATTERISRMVRQTDAVLTAMARTIAIERDKLEVLANGLAMPSAGQDGAIAARVSEDPAVDAHERILPLAGNGETVSAIAHRLGLPEAEVSLVIRLNAG